MIAKSFPREQFSSKDFQQKVLLKLDGKKSFTEEILGIYYISA